MRMSMTNFLSTTLKEPVITSWAPRPRPSFCALLLSKKPLLASFNSSSMSLSLVRSTNCKALELDRSVTIMSAKARPRPSYWAGPAPFPRGITAAVVLLAQTGAAKSKRARTISPLEIRLFDTRRIHLLTAATRALHLDGSRCNRWCFLPKRSIHQYQTRAAGLRSRRSGSAPRWSEPWLCSCWPRKGR